MCTTPYLLDSVCENTTTATLGHDPTTEKFQGIKKQYLFIAWYTVKIHGTTMN